MVGSVRASHAGASGRSSSRGTETPRLHVPALLQVEECNFCSPSVPFPTQLEAPEEHKELTPEEQLADKLRLKKLQEESDLELAKETFGKCWARGRRHVLSLMLCCWWIPSRGGSRCRWDGERKGVQIQTAGDKSCFRGLRTPNHPQNRRCFV